MTLDSPLDGVSDSKWTQFVYAMMTAQSNAVSDSNALGMFEMSPRRLSDLGVLYDLVRARSKRTGRMIWCGKFRAPLSSARFLRNPLLQYQAFVKSMKRYDQSIDKGQHSRAGALALLHRCGPKGLVSDKWFSQTQALYDKTKDIF